MASLLAQANLVTLLSEHEAQGLAVMEALTLKRPVLVAGTSALQELADRGLALAVPLESTPEEVATAVVGQLRQPLVPQDITLPTWDACAASLLALYQDIIWRVTMRIMMLSQFYPPIIGGGAIHVQSLSAELFSRGHEVAIVTLRHQGQAEFELDQGVRVYRISSLMSRLPWLFSDNERQYAPPFPDPGVMLGLCLISLFVNNLKIVDAHNWLVHSFLPMKAWSGARLVVTLHNYNLVCVKTTLLYQGTNCEATWN